MVLVTRLNGKEFYLNPELIQVLEETPDTVVTLTTGQKLVVTEKTDVLMDRILQYRIAVHTKLPDILRPTED